MSSPTGYVLGTSERAARRLAIQDAHFAAISEALLDELALRPTDRVVELGCGPGAFSRRILRRLGEGGALIGVDSSKELLEQAARTVQDISPARFEPIATDIAKLGDWLKDADVVVGRAVLHHIPMVEIVLGRMQRSMRPGSKLGFLEPDFRAPLARIASEVAAGQSALAPLLTWARAINQLYQAKLLSPEVGANLARTLTLAGFQGLQEEWRQFRLDPTMIENMLMFYDEVRDELVRCGIMTAEEIQHQGSGLNALASKEAMAPWGMYKLICRN